MIALVILMVVIGVVNAVLGVIPILGWILTIILAPAFSIFASRYITQIYDSVTAPN